MPTIEFRPVSPEEEKATLDSLNRHCQAHGGILHQQTPCSWVAYAHGKHIASLIGKTFWNWMYVDLLWVHEDHRKAGLGGRLMRQAEEKAREMGLIGIYCWTESWQAPEFYKKMGFEEFTVFENFPVGHQRYGLRKHL